ncbi:hypothetical protein [Corynebacterium riegelii]|uniref:hypothetical protein n=1 Tax=Corynebacterium riegelii TaxID=156976 RepID=UPI0023F38C69|nr:hypothetical protein [Corynebacterium riegelii]
MGEILFEKFAKVQKYVLNLTEEQRSGIRETVFWCDDDTKDEYSGTPKRKNYVGAHLFMSIGSLAEELNKDDRTIERWLGIWEKAGWFARQKDVRALDGNMTYANYVRGRPKSQHPASRVFNVSMLCRLLDVRATILSNKLRIGRDKELELLIDFALQVREDDFENPPIRAIKDYKPRLIDDWTLVAQEGPPDKWEDLYEPKKESARPGACAKVETGDTTKGTGNPEEGLSVTDHTISTDDFAKEPTLKDQFPLIITYISDVTGDYVDIVFQLEDITDEGVLVPDTHLPSDEEEKRTYLDEVYGVPPKIAQFNEKWGEEMMAFVLKRSQKQ